MENSEEKDFDELIENCEWEWVKSGNTLGYKITKRKSAISLKAKTAIAYSYQLQETISAIL